MKTINENDTTNAGCESCGKIVSVTFRYGTYKIGILKFENVLQGYCDVCGNMVILPHQSTFQINQKER